MDSRVILVAVALVFAAAGAGVWAGGGTGEPPPSLVLDWEPGPESTGQITVHVSGWVLHPGLVTVDGDSRVAEIVAAAGGALPGAKLDTVNLAQVLRDGDQLVIPGPHDDALGVGGEEGGPLRLNSASAQQFEGLPGVGPVLAERIVTYRETHGPFGAVEDLLDVPGIGERKLESIRDLVSP